MFLPARTFAVSRSLTQAPLSQRRSSAQPPYMPPMEVPRKGSSPWGSSEEEEEFDEEQLAAFLSSSLPDHHYGLLVGSVGSLPAATSLPRSLSTWHPPADIYHAPALDDLECGGDDFSTCAESDGEGKDVAGDEEQGVQSGAAAVAVAAAAMPALPLASGTEPASSVEPDAPAAATAAEHAPAGCSKPPSEVVR